MDHLKNAVVVDGSYPSTGEKLIQEWAPIQTSQNHELSKLEPFDNIKNIVNTFEIPAIDQLRYGGELELKIGNKIEGFLELLQKGVVIGDGNYSEMHEICGNSKLKELVLEYADKLNEEYCEYLQAGSDVLQALTFCPLMAENADNPEVKKFNDTACKLVCKLAAEQNSLVAGTILPSPDYMKGGDKRRVQTHFKQQLEVFNKYKVDVIVCDMYAVEEAEWALEIVKDSGVPIAVTLCVDKLGTVSGTSLGHCAIRMAKAGADVVGICCKLDVESPEVISEYVRIMKAALDGMDLQQHIMSFPHASSMPDNQHHSHHNKDFCSESKPLEQALVERYARALFEAGVRFFRAGCGLGTSYIKHLSNELVKERARIPVNIKPCGLMDKYQPIRKGSKQYWTSVISPSSFGTSFVLPESA